MVPESFYQKGWLTQSWGWLLCRGVLALCFSLLVFFWPLSSIVALAWLWGIFVLLDSSFSVAVGWKMRSARYHRSWPYLLWGLLGIVAGVVALLYPDLTALVLLTLIAFWAILGGIFQVIATINMRDAIDSFWSSLVFGVISVVFGVMILGRPLGRACCHGLGNRFLCGHSRLYVYKCCF